MKYKIFLLVIVSISFAECSSPPAPYYTRPTFVPPGNFSGDWIVQGGDQNCSAVIYEADSIVRATIVNELTHEVVTLHSSATFDFPPDTVHVPHRLYRIAYQSNSDAVIFPDGCDTSFILFTDDGDGFNTEYWPRGKYVEISCQRK